jgi:hypothetical protein
MKVVIRCLIFLILTAIFSCEKGFFIYCPDCLPEEPSDAMLLINLTYGYDFEVATSITINIYEGNIEDNLLIHSLDTFGPKVEYKVMLNKKYTVTATYRVSDKNYIAVDSAIPRVKYDKSQCDTPCYMIYDKKLNLKLKYE